MKKNIISHLEKEVKARKNANAMSKHVYWEYREEKLYFKGGKKVELLNELGNEGWELCAFVDDSRGTAYFKRPLAKKREPIRPKTKKNLTL